MVGRRIGNYRVLSRIGEGGMGAVYHAVDEMVERDVAIKVLRPDIARHPDTYERFRNEAILLAKLNHSNIATLYSFIKEDDEHFMIIEFVKGMGLDRLIERQGAQPLETAVSIASKALLGLKHAHSVGVLHRDVKPANILITETGGVKVTDFGIARIVNSQRMTREGRIIGTIEYIAPERILGEHVDARSDLYSLGVVLFEMLSGKLPFFSVSDFGILKQHLETPVPNLNELGVNVPSGIQSIVEKAMAKQPADRYESAAAFLADLSFFLPEAPTIMVEIPAAVKARRSGELAVDPALLEITTGPVQTGESDSIALTADPPAQEPPQPQPLPETLAAPEEPAPEVTDNGKPVVLFVVAGVALALLMMLVWMLIGLEKGGATPPKKAAPAPAKVGQQSAPAPAPQTPVASL